MNSIIIKGRLTRDPELRNTQSGTPVASFTVAVNRRFAPKGEERQADFIDCVAWRNAGEHISKYYCKGQEILIRGSLQSRKWEDKEGNKRTSWEIVVDETDFCGSKSDRSAGGESSNTYHNSGKPVDVSASDFSELEEDDGDLPF